ILLVLNQNIAHSADPMVEQQAINIAEAYLDEILNQSYADANGVCTGESRATLDSVQDYVQGSACLPDTVVRDDQGTAVSGLTNYSVSVALTPTTLGGISATRVDVNVSYTPTNISLTLSGYRTNY
ncbi:MAG: prepilin-type N-terminal cleavage/methylation domain-containing protein, partial [Candidatus Saccharimonadales bacterium]